MIILVNVQIIYNWSVTFATLLTGFWAYFLHFWAVLLYFYKYVYLERQTYKIHNHATLTVAVLSEPHFKWIIIIIIIIIP